MSKGCMACLSVIGMHAEKRYGMAIQHPACVASKSFIVEATRAHAVKAGQDAD